MRPCTAFCLAILAAACARGEASNSMGHVTVDTVGRVPRTVTESPVGWRDTSGWKLVESARIAGGTDAPGELIDPQDVAIGDDGSIYVSENSPSVIKKFTPQGAFVRTIGREGEGPGEFRAGFIASRGGELLVHDPRSLRTSVFDTAGTFLRAWHSVCCYYSSIPMDSSGAVGLPTMAPRDTGSNANQPFDHLVRWYRSDSVLVDSTLMPSGPDVKRWTIKQGKNGIMSTTVPWVPNQISTFLPDRTMLVGYANGYQIAVTDRTGRDTTALFGRTWTPVPIPDAVRRAEVERRVTQTSKFWDERAVRNAFLLTDVPTSAPAFDWLGLDGQGNIWARTPLPGDSTRTLFDIFDPAHRWLGQVAGSGLLRAWGMKLSGDHMIGFGEDDDGNPVVVVYRIQRGGWTTRRVGG